MPCAPALGRKRASGASGFSRLAFEAVRTRCKAHAAAVEALPVAILGRVEVGACAFAPRSSSAHGTARGHVRSALVALAPRLEVDNPASTGPISRARLPRPPARNRTAAVAAGRSEVAPAAELVAGGCRRTPLGLLVLVAGFAVGDIAPAAEPASRRNPRGGAGCRAPRRCATQAQHRWAHNRQLHGAGHQVGWSESHCAH